MTTIKRLIMVIADIRDGCNVSLTLPYSRTRGIRVCWHHGHGADCGWRLSYDAEYDMVEIAIDRGYFWVFLRAVREAKP